MASIEFDILVSYKNGTWIYVAKFLTVKGHISARTGAGTPQRQLENNLLEPGTALDGLVLAINSMFTNHLG